MKKRTITCLVLCLILMLQSISVCYAAKADALDYSDFCSATRLLTAIKVTDGIDFDSQAENFVTRYEFALLVTRILNADTENYTSDAVFEDVSQEQYATVAYVYDNKIMLGNGNSSFEPDRYITANEALKTLICILGYDVKAYLSGNSTQSYVQMANRVGLTDDITFHKDDRVQYKYVARMFYNALRTNMFEQTKFGNTEKYTESGDTLLYRYFGIEFSEGIVEANDISAISGSKAPGNMIRVDGVNYRVGETNASQLLGYNVTVYYDADSANKEIILADESDLSNSVRLDAKDVEFDNMTYKYYADGKTKELKIAKSASIVVNGAVKVYSKNIMVPASGYINLIDTNNDNKYELVAIEAEQVEISDGYNSLNEKIGLKYNRGSVDLSKYDDDKIHIYNANGTVAKPTELVEWTVLSIIENSDEIFIYKSTDKITGDVEQINLGTDSTVVIEGNEYTVSDVYLSHGNLELGNSGTFYLDRHKSIVGLRTNGSEWIYAYMLDAKRNGSGLENNCKIKAFTTADGGLLKIFEMAKSFVIDGEKCTSNGTIKNGSTNKFDLLTPSQVIRYKANSAGEITNIETVNSGEFKRIDLTTNDFRKMKFAYNTFATTIGVDNNTKIIVVPNDSESADADYNYQLSSLGYFVSGVDYKVKSYKENNEDIAADVVVVESVTACDAKAVMGVVDSLVKTTNSLGEETIKMNIVQINGAEASVMFKDMEQYKAVSPAKYDIVRYNLNDNGSLRALEKLYDATSGKTNTAYSGTSRSLDTQCTLVKGKLMDKGSGFITVKDALKSDDADPYLFTTGNTLVIICEKTDDKGVEKGSVADLEDYHHFGTEYDTVEYVRYMQLMCVFVYK